MAQADSAGIPPRSKKIIDRAGPSERLDRQRSGSLARRPYDARTMRVASHAAVFVAAFALAAPTDVCAGEAALVDVAGPVTELRRTGGGEVLVRAGAWFRLAVCDPGPVCTEPAGPPRLPPTAPDGIPHGAVATSATGGITRAWYTEPTTRYAHGVLGDCVEGGGLALVEAGTRHELHLARRFVFEDLTPRLADLDGDGRNEIVTIRSDRNAGAAIAVYGLVDGEVRELAAIAPIGRANRWLNVAGIADYSGDGRPDIAIVKTPHIGGRFELWTFAGRALRRLAAAGGFSNHAIGSTELKLSATADVDANGVVDLALPDAARAALRVLSMSGGALREIDRTVLPGRVATALGVVAGRGGPVLVAGLEDGRLAAVVP